MYNLFLFFTLFSEILLTFSIKFYSYCYKNNTNEYICIENYCYKNNLLVNDCNRMYQLLLN